MDALYKSIALLIRTVDHFYAGDSPEHCSEGQVCDKNLPLTPEPSALVRLGSESVSISERASKGRYLDIRPKLFCRTRLALLQNTLGRGADALRTCAAHAPQPHIQSPLRLKPCRR